MLEEVPEVTRTLGDAGLKAYRVKYILHPWDRFVAGDTLIVNQEQPAYKGDTIVIDMFEGARFRSYQYGDSHHSGVVVEIRKASKATAAAERQIERRKQKPIKSAAQIIERIASEMPKREEGYSTFREKFDRSNLDRLPRCHRFSSVTITGGLGDVLVPESLAMGTLLVEEGTNLIVSGSLKVSDDVIVRGSLSVDDKLECDDRLYVAGDFRTKGFVDCGRLLVGGDVQGEFTIAVKEYAAIGGSLDISGGGDDIRCKDLFVGGDLCASLWTENAVIARNMKSKGLIHVDNDLSVGRDLRAEEVEAGGRIAVGGTLWSKTVIAASRTSEIVCTRRLRGRVKSGILRELDPSAKTPKWGPQLLPIASRASVATIH
jgi:cytoskeletal protein CcmA (bactofilin family)